VVSLKRKILIGIIMIILVVFLAGCESGVKYVYNISMVEPKSTGEPLAYEDDMLAIKFTPLITSDNKYIPPALKAINFQIRNLSDRSIKILWNDMSFIDIDNTVSKIMHYGVKYTKRGESMSPTSIPAGTILEDSITPTDRVSWSSISNDWFNSGIVNEHNAGQYHQEEIGITLPIEYNGEVQEYLFKFKVIVKTM
jgi:hypothetical protein